MELLELRRFSLQQLTGSNIIFFFFDWLTRRKALRIEGGNCEPSINGIEMDNLNCNVIALYSGVSPVCPSFTCSTCQVVGHSGRWTAADRLHLGLEGECWPKQFVSTFDIPLKKKLKKKTDLLQNWKKNWSLLQNWRTLLSRRSPVSRWNKGR